ncbi:MAG: class I SAM-dependent methyltransferase [Lachnospiraceae bacterium]|nr:class I SAM-dependent methyltransferase [Lachnospiraceae bacterium]
MDGLSLFYEDGALWLTDGNLRFCADLSSMIPRIKRGVIGTELLVRAARLKDMSGGPTLIDAAAGLGSDGLLLAAAGFNVTLCEYNPVIAALLEDSLKRAASVPELSDTVSRMNVRTGDSIPFMRDITEKPDVIYLDPMFPESGKDALIKKKFQLLRKLELPCSNEEELLEAAVSAGPHKIVIKRPIKGPYLAGRKPSYSIEGKAVRYDCLICA